MTKDMKGLTLLTLWRNETDSAMIRCMAAGGAQVLVLPALADQNNWGGVARSWRKFRKETQRLANVSVSGAERGLSREALQAFHATAGADFEPAAYAYQLCHAAAALLPVHGGSIMLTDVVREEFGSDWFDRFQRVWMTLCLDAPRQPNVFFYDVTGKEVTVAYATEAGRIQAQQEAHAAKEEARSADGSYEELQADGSRKDGLQQGFQDPVLQAE